MDVRRLAQRHQLRADRRGAGRIRGIHHRHGLPDDHRAGHAERHRHVRRRDAVVHRRHRAGLLCDVAGAAPAALGARVQGIARLALETQGDGELI
ncbi:hypothetical protein G6F68_016879 [Rhizopus microsporus]|nr:hypothetical protein G6F68_016879 [Rhizopus microsporus]